MEKRETIFLEALVLSLTLILIFATVAYCNYPSVFEMSPSEKICLEQERKNQEFRDWPGQGLSFTSIAPKFGLIRNTIWANAEPSRWLTWILPAEPKSITAQDLFQSLARASPP